MANRHCILSIDAGGTKTDGLVLDRDKLSGVMLSREGSNPNIYREQGVATITSIVKTLIEKGGVLPEDVEDCVIGLAGISRTAYRKQIEKALNKIFPQSSIHLISDAQLAHHGIWGKASGITLIVGTGSIAVGIDEEGTFYRAGGFGYNIGDEGSGYCLGKSVITQLITNEQSTDEEVVSIRDEFVAHVGAPDFEGMLRILSMSEKNISTLAGLTPIILKAAEDSNFFVNQTVMQGAECLADLILELTEKMGITEEKLLVGISGSVIVKSNYYRNLIEDHLLYDFPEMEWVLPQFPSVYGGLAIASYPIQLDNFSKLVVEIV
ncbi:MAG: hypothetical protein IIA61_11040 [Candidatus Marinimicrobia bacterium]|nr:hypothetical protein [Candidatus Neomarinimicrobiota bacterium]